MDFFTMTVALVAIGCGTSIVRVFITSVFGGGRGPSRKDQEALLKELSGLREELKLLRQQNNDVILSLDTAMHRVDHRITHLETRGELGPAAARASETSELASRSETSELASRSR